MKTRCRRFRGFSLVELLVVIAIIGLMVQMMLPAVQMSREAARNTSCQNHLRQLAMAAVHHESTHGHFPSGGWGRMWTGDPDRGVGANQPGSWCYQLLPFLEQEHLYKLGAGEEWETKIESARRLCETPLPVFNCPTRRPCKTYRFWPSQDQVPGNYANPEMVAKTCYAANGGDICPQGSNKGPVTYEQADQGQYEWIDASEFKGVVFQRSEITCQQISDGLSSTYLFGEKHCNCFTDYDPGDNQSMYHGHDADTIRYTYTRHDNEALPNPDTHASDSERYLADLRHYAWGSSHPHTFNMSFCDGSVHSIPFLIDFTVHQRLANRRDGKTVDMTELK